jgi:large subunit ribosomal protein L10
MRCGCETFVLLVEITKTSCLMRRDFFNFISIAQTREQKTQQIKDLVSKIQEAKSVVFANYSHISVAKQTQLRNFLRSNNAELKVAKKTLFKKAAEELGYGEISDDVLDGQIVVAFSYEDPTVSAQAIKKMSKEVESLSLKGGLFEGKILSCSDVNELADLPPREVLIAKLLGSMMSPVSGFVSASNGVISGFVRVLNAHTEKLSQ